jgi:hypothetical protein
MRISQARVIEPDLATVLPCSAAAAAPVFGRSTPRPYGQGTRLFPLPGLATLLQVTRRHDNSQIVRASMPANRRTCTLPSPTTTSGRGLDDREQRERGCGGCVVARTPRTGSG